MSDTKIKHIKSAVLNKVPQPDQLEYGQISVNFNADNPFLAIKNTEDEIVKIPSESAIGGIVEQEVAEKLPQVIGQNYYTKTQTDAAINSLSAATDTKLATKANASDIPSLEGYATEQWVQNQNYLTEHQDISDLATKSEVAEGLAGKSNTGHTHTLSQITDYVAPDLTPYETSQHASQTYQVKGDYALKSEIPTVPTNVSEFTNDAGYLTEHQSLSNYYTKDQTSGATQIATALEGKADNADIPSLDGYATEQWVEDKNYLTEHQDISGLATKIEVNALSAATDTKLAGKADNDDIPTKTSELTNDSGFLTEHQSLSNYYTKSETSGATQISTALAGKADIGDVPTDVYTKDETNAAISAATEDMATETWVTNQNYLTQHQDISNLATKAEVENLSGTVDTKLEGKADIDEIPTKTSELTNDSGFLTEHQSLSNYYTKSETSGATQIATALAGKADNGDIPDISSYFNNAQYDSETKRINFYHGETIKAYIDATDFIKDGMVDSVTIADVGGVACLVITFNSDSGKENINIPLTRIFNPSNYYTKTEVDSAISAATDDMATVTWVTSQNYLTEHQSLEDYALKSEIPTVPTNVSAFNNDAGYLTEHQSLSNYYTKAETSGATQIATALSTKADVEDIPSLEGYATEQWVEGKNYLTEHQSLSAYSTTQEVNQAISTATDDMATKTWVGEQNYLTEHQSLDNYYTKSETSGATEIATALAGKANTSDIPSLEGYATEQWVEDKNYLTEHQDISGLATKVEVNALSAATDTKLAGKSNTGHTHTLSQITDYVEPDLTPYATNAALNAHSGNTTMHVTAEEKATWNAKTDFSGDYNDLINKPTIPVVPTNVSDFVNDAGYLTEHQSLSNYYTKSQTSGATQIATALESKANVGDIPSLEGYATQDWVESKNYLTEHQSLSAYSTSAEVTAEIAEATSGKQDTLIAGENITISGNTISATGGGGASYTAGAGISISEENVISTSVIRPAGSGYGAIIGDSECSASDYSLAVGHNADASLYSFALGSNVTTKGQCNFALGSGAQAGNNYSPTYTFSFGTSKVDNTAKFQFALGDKLKVNRGSSAHDNFYVFGLSNKYNHASSNFGHSGNSLFSIGNGYDYQSTHNYHNAFDVRQNGDIYVPNTDDTSVSGSTAYSEYPMVRLQDTITQTAANTLALANKQDTLIAGEGISISGNTISATGGGGGASYTAGSGIVISADTISIDNDVLQATANAIYNVTEDLHNTNKNLSTNYSTTAAADLRYATNASINRKLTDYYKKDYIDNRLEAISAGLVDLHENSGGSITVDPSLNSGSTNPVANSAITEALEAKFDASGITAYMTSAETTTAINTAVSGKADTATTYTKTESNSTFELKAWRGTQAEYDALATKDADRLYIITN